MNLAIEQLKAISVHRVGNRYREEPLVLSQMPSQVSEDVLEQELLSYFLGHFEQALHYHFSGSLSGPDMNTVFSAAAEIFERPEDLHRVSVDLARRLHELSDHQAIKSGDFYVALISDVMIEDEVTEALAIFKAESRDRFLSLAKENGTYQISMGEGTFTGKVDKGCLIYNTDREQGYHVRAIDSNRGPSPAQYWIHEFLGLQQRVDSYYHTQHVMDLTQDFIKSRLPREVPLEKVDQADLLNRSLDYFKGRSQYDEQEFADEVFQDVEIADAFGEFRDDYRARNQLQIEPGFDLHGDAVKKQASGFRSVLKLDRNFHIYIHGDRRLIEKGVDEHGRKFYRIFYQEES